MDTEWQADLKRKFYYYLGVMRLTDQEKIVIAKIVCYSQFPIGRSCHTMYCHMEKYGQSGDRESKESMSWNLYCGFHGKGKARQSKQA